MCAPHNLNFTKQEIFPFKKEAAVCDCKCFQERITTQRKYARFLYVLNYNFPNDILIKIIKVLSTSINQSLGVTK